MSESKQRISDLLDRISRLNQSQSWDDGLNPAQLAALRYLVAANQFSRAPSHVADYLGATRGTVSQSLKTLDGKGLITQIRSSSDKRRARYDVTPQGHALLGSPTQTDSAIEQLDENERAHLAKLLSNVLHMTLRARGGKSFGICKNCKHHGMKAKRPYCRLLDVELADHEIDQICHEHETAA